MSAHCQVYSTLKKLPDGAKAQIGIVKNIFQMDPYHYLNPLDHIMAGEISCRFIIICCDVFSGCLLCLYCEWLSLCSLILFFVCDFSASSSSNLVFFSLSTLAFFSPLIPVLLLVHLLVLLSLLLLLLVLLLSCSLVFQVRSTIPSTNRLSNSFERVTSTFSFLE